VHTVIHIVDDVQSFGALDNISCFPFENHLRHMKNLIRRPGAPLQQLICRLSELDAHKSSAQYKPQSSISNQHDNGAIPDDMRSLISLTQYRECNIKCYKLKATLKDGVILLCGGQILMIRNIISHGNEMSIVYQQFMDQRSLHNYPFSSSDIDMCIVSKLHHRLCTVSCSQIERKCLCLPLKDSHQFAVMPYAHNE